MEDALGSDIADLPTEWFVDCFRHPSDFGSVFHQNHQQLAQFEFSCGTIPQYGALAGHHCPVLRFHCPDLPQWCSDDPQVQIFYPGRSAGFNLVLALLGDFFHVRRHVQYLQPSVWLHRCHYCADALDSNERHVHFDWF